MDKELSTINEKKTFFCRKVVEIKDMIFEAFDEYADAKNDCMRLKNELANTSSFHFIKKSRLKKEYRNAMDELTFSNSNAIIFILKILGMILELLIFVFLTPMDLIQKMGQWVAEGFEKRDDKMVQLVGIISPLLDDKKSGKSNLFEGFLRLIIVVIVILLIFFGIKKIFINNLKQEETNSVENVLQIEESEKLLPQNDIYESEKITVMEKEILKHKVDSNELNSISIQETDLLKLDSVEGSNNLLLKTESNELNNIYVDETGMLFSEIDSNELNNMSIPETDLLEVDSVKETNDLLLKTESNELENVYVDELNSFSEVNYELSDKFSNEHELNENGIVLDEIDSTLENKLSKTNFDDVSSIESNSIEDKTDNSTEITNNTLVDEKTKLQ